MKPTPEMSREEFLKIIWRRFTDESKSHHSSTLRYGQMLREMQGWEEPEPVNPKIIVTIGGYISGPIPQAPEVPALPSLQEIQEEPS